MSGRASLVAELLTVSQQHRPALCSQCLDEHRLCQQQQHSSRSLPNGTTGSIVTNAACDAELGAHLTLHLRILVCSSHVSLVGWSVETPLVVLVSVRERTERKKATDRHARPAPHRAHSDHLFIVVRPLPYPVNDLCFVTCTYTWF